MKILAILVLLAVLAARVTTAPAPVSVPAAPAPEPEIYTAEDDALDAETELLSAAGDLVDLARTYQVGDYRRPGFLEALRNLADKIRSAIDRAHDLRLFIDQKRAELRAALLQMAAQLSEAASRMQSAAAGLGGVSQALIAAGPPLTAKGEGIRALGFRCRLDLGPGISSTGIAIGQSGATTAAAAHDTAVFASALQASANQLTALVAVIDEGGRDIEAFQAQFAAILVSLRNIASAEIGLGNTLVRLADHQAGVGNGMSAVGSSIVSYADCRNERIGHRLPRRVRRDQRMRAAAGKFFAKGTATVQASGELRAQGTDLVDRGNQTAAKLNALDTSRLPDLMNNFSGCVGMLTIEPKVTRAPVQVDTHAVYRFYAARQPDSGPIALRVEGELPRLSPYFSFSTYATGTGALQAIVVDKNLAAAGDGKFRLYLLPHRSPSLGRLPESTLELPAHPDFTFVMRIYAEKGTPRAAAPILRAVSGTNLDKLVMCPGKPQTAPTFPEVTDPLPPVPAADGKILFYRPLTAQVPFPDGGSAGQCSSGYLLARTPGKRERTVDVIRLRAKATPAQAGYVSIGAVGNSVNPQTSQSGSYSLSGNLAGDEMRVVNGVVTIALVPGDLTRVEEERVLATATRLGHNLMRKPDDAYLVYRVKTAAADFPGNPASAPCYPGTFSTITPDFAATGDFFPSGQAYSVADFLRGQSDGVSLPLVDGSAGVEARLVWNLYQDLLLRAPTLSDLIHWVAIYDRQGPAAVIRGVLDSPERTNLVSHQISNELVKRPITASFGGPFDYLNFAVTIGGSEEARVKAGGCAGLVSSLFRYFLKRDGDPAWIPHCENPAIGAAGTAFGIIRSLEAAHRLVESWYQAFLGRLPDPAGRASLLHQLNSGTPLNQMLFQIVASEEYRDKRVR